MRCHPVRCTFVHAPNPSTENVQYLGMRFMPAWIYTLAAWAPNDGRFLLRMADTRIEDVCAIGEADIFLFSAWNQDLDHVETVRARLSARFPGARTVIGGPIAWSFDEAGELDRLSGFEHVYIGDGVTGDVDMGGRLKGSTGDATDRYFGTAAERSRR